MTALVVARAYLSPMLILRAFERPDARRPDSLGDCGAGNSAHFLSLERGVDRPVEAPGEL